MGAPFTPTKPSGMSLSRKVLSELSIARSPGPRSGLQWWKPSATQSWGTKHIVAATSPNDREDTESGENVPSVREG